MKGKKNEKWIQLRQLVLNFPEEKKDVNLFRVKQLINDIIEEKEFEKWFALKQLLSGIILEDLKVEWNEGNLPSTYTKTYELVDELTKMVEQSFVYLKERGDIYIMENPDRGSNIILGEDWIRRLEAKGRDNNIKL